MLGSASRSKGSFCLFESFLAFFRCPFPFPFLELAVKIYNFDFRFLLIFKCDNKLFILDFFKLRLWSVSTRQKYLPRQASFEYLHFSFHASIDPKNGFIWGPGATEMHWFSSLLNIPLLSTFAQKSRTRRNSAEKKSKETRCFWGILTKACQIFDVRELFQLHGQFELSFPTRKWPNHHPTQWATEKS